MTLRRALVKIGKRDRAHKDSFGYYDWWRQEVFLVRAWHESMKHVEENIERNIEHETIHHVLANRVSRDACMKFDDVPYFGNGTVVFGLKGVSLPPCKSIS